MFVVLRLPLFGFLIGTLSAPRSKPVLNCLALVKSGLERRPTTYRAFSHDHVVPNNSIKQFLFGTGLGSPLVTGIRYKGFSLFFGFPESETGHKEKAETWRYS